MLAGAEQQKQPRPGQRNTGAARFLPGLQMQRVLGPGMSVVPSVTVSDGGGVVFKVAIVAIILALGVVVGAVLWINRIRKGES